jgi:UDP-glucose 4-epimerase
VDDYCDVSTSAGWISQRLGVEPRFEYTGGDRGWVGDNPFIYLDTTKIRATGWSPVFGIREAIERTVDFLVENDWLVRDRASAP